MSTEFEELFGEWGQDSEGNPKSLDIETYQGRTGMGESFAAAHTITGLPTFYGSTLVRDSTGNEVTSTASVWVPLGADADRFTLGSRVTLPDPAAPGGSRRTSVLQVSAPDVYGLFGFRVVALA